MEREWKVFHSFLRKAYEGRTFEEVLDLFPQFLCTLLDAEKMLLFCQNDILGEPEVIKSFGYTFAELEDEKIQLINLDSGAREKEERFLLASLPQELTFITYFLYVKGKKKYNEIDREIFHTIVYQLALIMKKFFLIEKAQQTYLDTIQALARTIDARCESTKGHSERVTRYTVAIAQALGWSGQQIEDIRQAALLHDLGKIGIADSILKKAAGLTDEEKEEMKKHPEYTADILSGVSGLQHILPMAQYHHECYDGSGYPLGLKGNQIPLGARIIAVADAFDAMTADRVYRKAMSVPKAVEIIQKGSGSQFDPLVATALIGLLEGRKITWQE